MITKIDSKLSETKGDIAAFIKNSQEKEKNWKYAVSNILKREKIAKSEETEILANLIK